MFIYKTPVQQTRTEVLGVGVDVVGVVHFVDTLIVSVPRKLAAEQWRELRKRNGPGRVSYPKCDAFRKLMVIQQPTRKALAYLSRAIEKYTICGIEVATDYITRSQDDANRLTTWFSQHAVLPYHRRGTKNQYETTHYWQRSRTARGLAVYGDKPSKVTGKCAAHVELRFARARGCQRLGVYTFNDVLKLDLRKVVSEHLHLYRARPNRLARMLRNRFDKRQLNRLRRDLGLTADQPWHEASMQDLKDVIPDNVWYRCAVKIEAGSPDQETKICLPTSNHDDSNPISQSRFRPNGLGTAKSIHPPSSSRPTSPSHSPVPSNLRLRAGRNRQVWSFSSLSQSPSFGYPSRRTP